MFIHLTEKSDLMMEKALDLEWIIDLKETLGTFPVNIQN